MTEQEPGKEQSTRSPDWDFMQCLHRIDLHMNKAIDLMVQAEQELNDVQLEIYKIENR